MNKPVHAFVFVGGRHIIKCGVKNGLVNMRWTNDITCKRCLKIITARKVKESP